MPIYNVSQPPKPNIMPKTEKPQSTEGYMMGPNVLVDSISSQLTGYTESFNQMVENLPHRQKTDAFGAVDEILDLSHRDLTTISEFLKTASPDEIDSFKQMIKRLTDRGIVGYEYLDIKGRPYKSFISTRFVEPYSSARIYRGPVRP